jgi:type I restriction enzyme S subunit
MADRSSSLPHGWRRKSFSELADVSFSGVDKKTTPGEIPVRLCNYVDVFHNHRIHSGIDFMTATASEREVANFKLLQGDVVFTKDSETPEEIAEPAYVAEDLCGVVCGYHLAIARPKKDVDGRFLYYAMKETGIRRQFTRSANGVTRFGLTLDAFDKIFIPTPVLEEQTRIAEILSTWDETLARLSLQIERKAEVFASLREAVVHGTRRIDGFDGPWQTVTIGSFLKLHNERVGNGSDLPVYSITKVGMLPQEQHFNKRIANSDLSRHIIVRNGDLALSGLNFWLGSVDVSTLDEPVCISPDYKVFKINGSVDPKYMRHVVRTARFVTLLKNAAVERASIVRKNFDRETFLASELQLPEIREQRAIVEVLDDAEREIAALEAERAALARQRDALATELLTGRLRVPQAEAAS